MKVLITKSAETDLEEAADFYEGQEAGAGDYFMRHIVGEIDELAGTGGMHSRVWGYHKALVKRFPYLIFYFIRDDAVHVRAVLDGRRDPARIRRIVVQRKQQDDAS